MLENSKVMIALKTNVTKELRKARKIDNNSKFTVSDKKYGNILDTILNSKEAYCLNSSRNIGCK